MIQDEPRTEKQMLAEVKEAIEYDFDYANENGNVARIKSAYVIHAEEKKVVFFIDNNNRKLKVELLEDFLNEFKRIEK